MLYNEIDDTINHGVAMKTEESKNLVDVLRELGLSYEETADVMMGVAGDLRSLRVLLRRGDNSWVIKLGLALIAFPEPVISDIVGSILVSAGVLHAKMKRSALHIEDVPNTLQGVIKDLQLMRRDLI